MSAHIFFQVIKTFNIGPISPSLPPNKHKSPTGHLPGKAYSADRLPSTNKLLVGLHYFDRHSPESSVPQSPIIILRPVVRNPLQSDNCFQLLALQQCGMADGDARDYVLAYENDKPGAAKIASNTAQNLQDGKVQLIDVIKALGEYLNDKDPKIRDRATHYLSAVITSLAPNFITRHDLPFLNTFLCARIEDGGAIEGLSHLQSSDRYTKDMAQELAQSIFDHFSSDLQLRPQVGRFKVYALLNELLSNHREAIRDMGDKSLLGTLQVFSGEKDPRNLMLIFSMIRVLMIEWDISNHVETAFDSVYAYFPVTFRPPPNDPYGITAQDLKDRLRDCLSSTGLLAPLVFPNLLDRLDSTSEAVKKDVLQALAACALNYSPGTIAQFSVTLWDAVKFEVLQAQEPFLADEALHVIKNIAICLSKSTRPHSPTADPLVQYLKPINKECMEHLQEPASIQAQASGSILKAAASATIRSFEAVLKGIGPALFILQQSSDGVVNQRAILTTVNQLFEASIEVYGSWLLPSAKNENGQETLLVEFKDRLLAIYGRALMSTVKEEVSYRLAAAKGLLLLSQMASLLDENEIGLTVQHFNDIVLDEESYGRDELKQKAMQALAEISSFKPRLITDITFPKFIARLPSNEEEAASSKDYQAVLEGLAEISVGRDLLETLIRRLLNRLDLIFQTGWRATYPYTCAILSTIYYVLERSTRDSTVSLDGYFDRVVVGMSQKVAAATDGPLADEIVLQLLGRIINLVIRKSSLENQDQAAQNVYRLFSDSRQNELQSDSVQKPEIAMLLSTWILASLPKGSRSGILSTQLMPFLASLDDKAAQEGCLAAVQQAYLGQTAIVVNKYVTARSDLDQISEELFNKRIQATGNETDEQFQASVRYLFTLAKALVLRLAPSTSNILARFLDCLDSLPIDRARSIALCFDTLLSQDEIVSKSNDAQIRLLAPQRVFQIMVPILSAKFKDRSSTQERREIYLIALSGILGTVSSEIVMPELPTLLPLLLQSLELSDANQNIKIAALETMIVVITKNPEALIESGHIPALIRRLIAAGTLSKPTRTSKRQRSTPSPDVQMIDVNPLPPAATKPVSSSKSRQLALKCLTLLPQHIKDQKTPNPLLVLKREVLQGLTPCLDDPKRDVRKEAVDARARWLRGVDDVDDSDED